MWKPKYVRCVNLLTHSDTTFNFISGQMCMLLGVNKDDIGCNSNGSGKSTIIEAITLAMTGEVYRGVGKDDFIKYFTEFTTVEMELENLLLNKVMNIKRKIFANTKSSTLDVLINGEKPKHLPTATSGGVDVKFGNKEIFEQIGISKEDFLNYYVIGQGNNNSFFTTNDTKQKEIISRFSNFTQIDALLEQLEATAEIMADEKNNNKSQIDTCIELINFIQEDINDIHNNFKQDKTEKSQSIKNQIAKQDKHILESTDRVQDMYADIETIEQNISTVDIPNADGLRDKLNTIRQDLKEAESELRELKSRLQKLELQDGKVITCPKCAAKFIPAAILTVQDLKKDINATTLLIADQEAKIDGLELLRDKAKKSLHSIDELESKKRILEARLVGANDILKSIISDIEYAEKHKEELKAQLREVLTTKADAKVMELNNKIKAQQYNLKILTEKQNELSELDAQNSFHKFHFGKKGFKTFLANKSIKTIQDMCNFYMKKFETNLQISISGYKVLKSGEVRDKIEINVLKDGINKGDFKKYSGGEKSRVSICGIISINRLINNTSATGGLDLLILDENISYLDTTGQEEIIKILAKANITSILVMHNVDNYPYKYKIIVTKENGESKITQ